jgi:dynactin 1
MEAAKKEAEQIKSLQADLNKSVQQEQMYAEAVENLQAEYDTLEAENNALKKDAAKREEKRQSILRKANFDMPTDNGGDDATIQEMAGSYYEMTSQVETLKASIRYLRAENAHLKGSDFVRSLDLEPLKTPRPENRYTAVARETRTLIKDMRAASASPRVIQLSTKRHAHHQYQAQQSVLYTLQQRSLELRKQVDEIPVIHRTKKEFLGVIKVPSKTTNRHCVDLRSISEFEKIHSIFLKT